ncbi:hypothetical protein Tco_1065942 [Tanacetum coccineum]
MIHHVVDQPEARKHSGKEGQGKGDVGGKEAADVNAANGLLSAAYEKIDAVRFLVTTAAKDDILVTD